MDVNEYVLQTLVREKLEAARALRARHALAASARPRRTPLRARLGAALIALGERLSGEAPARASASLSRSCASPSVGRG